MTKAGEEIVEFGKKIPGTYSRREFDIITKTKLIECKNIDWSRVPDKMKSIIIDQSKIAKEMGKIFEFHSKNKVPSAWKEWFELKGIRVFED